MESTAPPLLEVEALDVDVGGRAVVRGASFSLARGERVALVGPSGGGKTTLLRAVVGLVDAARGAVRFAGAPVLDEARPAFRREVIWVAQRPVMLAGSVADNLAQAFGFAANAGRDFDRERAGALLERLGVGAARLGAEAARLSEGQRKRVALARALLLEPRALLLDEPASGLDAASASALEGLLVEEGGRRGLACAVVTHDLERARRLCHRVVDLTPWLRGAAA